METLKGSTDASPLILAQAGLSVLSTLAGKFVTINGETRLNEYYACIGATASRKTTGQKYARRLLKDVISSRADLSSTLAPKADDRLEPMSFSQIENVSGFSVEGLEQVFMGSGISGLVTPGEYKTVFDIQKRQSQGNTISSLVSFYDGEPITTVLRSRKVVIRDHCLTMLAVSTPTWFKQALSSDLIASGFLNRHLIIKCEAPEEPQITESRPDTELWQKLVSQFASIPGQRAFEIRDGSPSWTSSEVDLRFADDSARDIFGDYYRELHKRKIEANEEDADLIAREDVHALKLAGIKAFGERLPHIDTECVLFGIEMAQYSSKTLETLLIDMRVTPLQQHVAKTYFFILSRWQRDKLGTGHGDISRHFGGKQLLFREALDLLTTENKLTLVKGLYFPSDIRESADGVSHESA